MDQGITDLYSSFLDKAHQDFMKFIDGLKIPQTAQARLAMALAGTILEYTKACSDLLKAEHAIAAKCILRSILEAYVDLRCTLLDADYVACCELRHHADWLKVLKAARSEDNEYLDDLRNDTELDAKIKNSEVQIKELAQRGAKLLNIKQRFEKADLSEFYRSIYARLSASVHNDAAELARRHLVLEINKVSLVLFRQVNSTEYGMLYDLANGLLISALSDIQGLKGLQGDFDSVAKLRDRLISLRIQGDEIMRKQYP